MSGYSSRYSSNYSSGYGSGRDYSSSSYSSLRRDSGTGYSSNYTSKYGGTSSYDLDKYSRQSSATSGNTRNGSYSMAEEPKLEEVEAVQAEPENTEVLSESDVDHFKEDSAEVLEEEEQVEDEPVAIEEVEPELEAEAEPEPELDEEEVVEEKEELPVAREPSPARRLSTASPQNENRNPDLASPKKLNSGVWPPRDEIDGGARNRDQEQVTKKKVSDLIARFNSGNIENDSAKPDQKYKTEYGANKGAGKVQQSIFQ